LVVPPLAPPELTKRYEYSFSPAWRKMGGGGGAGGEGGADGGEGGGL